MKAETVKIIGYTDSVNECDCCGKTELKGTYCMDIDGTELYYGSVCAFKNHGLTVDEQKELKKAFTKELKNKTLYDIHIAPLKVLLAEKIDSTFTITDRDQLPEFAKKIYDSIVLGYNNVMDSRAKKYKITL